MRGLFVTGTDTGVGKSVVCASLAASMTRAGEPVRVHKPVLTGTAEPSGAWPSDDELLALAAGASAADVTPLRFAMAASPHLAAADEGVSIDPSAMIAEARSRGRGGTLLLEGVGGLLVPIADGFGVRELAAALELPLLLVARPGLGTINHTLLTLEAARTAGLRVAAVVLTPWPERPDEIARSNRETIARIGTVDVETLPRIPTPAIDELAAAGDSLPWRRWVRTGERAEVPCSG